MVADILELEREDHVQLIQLLEPSADLARVTDEDLKADLVVTLRRTLEVPENSDLPEVLRRRLIEVAVKDFAVADNLDTASDIEVAERIIRFLLDAAFQLANDDERRKDFEKFLRTKSAGERSNWLKQSSNFAAEFTGDILIRREARERALIAQGGTEPHIRTATMLLDQLGVEDPNKRWVKFASDVAPGSLGALAGGLFMAGRRTKDLMRDPEEEDGKEHEKARARRARRSKLVQNVVMICAFVVARALNEPGPALVPLTWPRNAPGSRP